MTNRDQALQTLQQQVDELCLLVSRLEQEREPTAAPRTDQEPEAAPETKPAAAPPAAKTERDSVDFVARACSH